MKIKIIYAAAGFLLGVLITFVPALLSYLFVPGEIPIVYEDVIPDESTAIKVAEAIFDAAYGTDYKVDTEVRVEFWEHENAWHVYYAKVSLENPERFSTASLPAIELRKDNGMVIDFGLQED